MTSRAPHVAGRSKVYIPNKKAAIGAESNMETLGI